jgi:hypothetical protein
MDELIISSIGEIEMPLVKGKKAKTRKGFGENVKREMEAGKPQKQAVAIAYSEKRSAGGKDAAKEVTKRLNDRDKGKR